MRHAAQGRRAGACSKGDTVQTTLLGLAIAFIIALVAALIGPYFIDWKSVSGRNSRPRPGG